MKIMGILNVTPDSFSDGGQHYNLQNALRQADRMIDEGVDVIDIGGESTRPFAEPVSAEEELERVLPAIIGIRKKYSIPLSIDTTKAAVAEMALQHGADIVNDISALRHDPAMSTLLQSNNVPVIIMHMKGSPETMQLKPEYEDVVDEVFKFFEERLLWLAQNGIEKSRITIDPGIGFGKTIAHNLSLIKHLDTFKSLGCSVMLGHSRKRFLGDITGLSVEERDLPTAVISALALSQGVDIIRVHNVGASRSAIKIQQALQSAA